MLAELEEIYLRPSLETMLTEMRNAFPAVWEKHGGGPLREGLKDVGL